VIDATVLVGLLGGVGLFLLGMELMTDGLRMAAGPALERILAASTRTRWRGLLAGVLVTALVQSSSAVTVATIGFVNAGLLALGQALWVLFGANVGTTMTGWIVAVLGFGVKIDALALPMVGVGVILRVTGAGTRRGALGWALAGFGLLFLGIEALKHAFDGVARHIELPAGGGALVVLAQLAIGLVMTVLMQSSSASLTLALSAAQSGLITAQGAAAVVIGANIGTTVTAVLAALGATANARRAAAAHVLFNVLTGGVALGLLPWLVQAILDFKGWLGLAPSPALTVALFHTSFNVMGVLLMVPLAARLDAWLRARFRSAEEDEARPRHLDPTVLAVPTLALDALLAELQRLRAKAAQALAGVFALPLWQGAATPAAGASAAEPQAVRAALARDRAVAHALQRAVAAFVVELQRAALSRDVADRLPQLLRIARYAEVAVEQADEAAEALLPWDSAVAGLPVLELAAFGRRAQTVIAETQAPHATADALQLALTEAEDAYAVLKAALLRAGAQGALDIEAMDAVLRAASALRRGLQQLVKGVQLALALRGAGAATERGEALEAPPLG